MDGTLAILGTGRMGAALLSGLLRSGASPEQIRCTVRSPDRARALAERFGVDAGTDSAQAAAGADVVVIAVKPQTLPELLAQIREPVSAEQTVVSVVAGVPTRVFEDALGDDVPVVRVMCNVCVQVDQSMSAVSPGRRADAGHLAVAEALFAPVGRVLRVPEAHMDAVTALSGSGPAYLFLVAEAMIDAGILLGLPRAVATELVQQTMLGSATMLGATGQSPAALRETVTSPGGTTIAALRVLEENGVRAAFLNAVEAAEQRARELGG